MMDKQTTERRAFLEAMVEKYQDNFKKGQSKEDIISSLSALTFMKEKTFEREVSAKKKAHYFQNTGLFANQIKEDLAEFDIAIPVSHRKSELASETLEVSNPSMIKKVLFIFDKFIKDTKTAFDIMDNPEGYKTPTKLESSLFLKMFDGIQKSLEDVGIIDGVKSKNIAQAKREFAAKAIKESIINLAINTNVHSSYYNDEYDKKAIFDIMKNLRDENFLPKEVESVYRKYNSKTLEYEFEIDPRKHSAYTILKGYDKLIENINGKRKEDGLKNSRTLSEARFKKMIDNLNDKEMFKNLPDLSPDELKMDIFTYALVKSSVVLSYINQTLKELKNGKNEQSNKLISDYSEVMKSLDDTQVKIVEALKINIDDMSNVASLKKLKESLLAIVVTRENGYDLIVNSLLDERLFESAKKIEVSSEDKIRLDILRDRYSDQVENIQAEASSHAIESSIDFKKFFYEKFPDYISNIKEIELEVGSVVKHIVEENSLQKRDLSKDRFILNVLS